MKTKFEKIADVVLGFLFAMMITALIFICLLCGGCSRKVYIPVESVRTEYREADTIAIYNRLLELVESRSEKVSRSDSLVDREKESVVLNTQGDTVRLTRTRYVYLSSNREKELETENKTLRDSLSIVNTRLESIKTDSVPSIVTVERELSRWEKTKMDFGGMAIGGLIAVVVLFIIVWLIKKKRK